MRCLLPKIFFLTLAIIISTVLFSGGSYILAEGYRPELSGGYEVGDGFDEEEGEEFFYREGWLKYKQKLTTDRYYYFKYRYYSKDFLLKDYYDNLTQDLILVYRFPLGKQAYVRLEGKGTKKEYYSTLTKNYRALSPRADFNYKWSNGLKWELSLRGKRIWYFDAVDKDLLSLTVVTGWSWKLNPRLELKCRYGLSIDDEIAAPGFPDKTKKYISLSFIRDL